MDKRNYNVTNKVFEVLNDIKGFEVAMSNPSKGTIIAKYKGTSFYINIEPIFNDNDEGKEFENRSFEEIARDHNWVFK